MYGIEMVPDLPLIVDARRSFKVVLSCLLSKISAMNSSNVYLQPCFLMPRSD
jgi:hypothetical protein